MKFSIKRSNFIDGINKVSRAISNKTTIPILTGIKIDATKKGITLTGSNADISIQTLIDSKDHDNELAISEPGSIVLPARFFSSVVKKLPDEMMSMSVRDDFQTVIKSGNSSFTINGLDASNYPHLPKINTDKSVKLSGDLFKEIIHQTVIAVSNQESRPILTGVHFALKNSQLLAVATDSHRLSQRKVALPNNKASYDVIIPGKSLMELSRMIDQHSDVEMRLSENQVLFLMGNTSFYSRLLEGNYPDTSQLIPDDSTTQVQFEAPALLAAIERASLLSHASRNNVIQMSLKPGQDNVTITGNSPDVGNVKEDLKPKAIKGKDLSISFNPDYMKDALKSLGNTMVNIDFLSALRPFTLLPTEDHQKNFVQLITPVRTF
ncbi:DNA polymerase III subunit beta [Acetilactobacillus jinshanensis]|uniref:Beta sliding clamp n=1 Tax=Acetilactobacillus jinshanensis TaxID=1720083 RepID=A0A4P6ZJL2_9LACO|nr:DNA polymerase III subunit beta [Acetilactobacillus jinshanensis]QBP17602.1 DNA polymerase III subunit beta [Acetilactobacillus jinshanensis]